VNRRLEGRIALITGAGGGIGAATAKLFSAEGARVLLVDMNADSLDRTVTAIRNDVPDAEVRALSGNVADPATAVEAASTCEQAFGGIDILVNNAAMRNYSSFADAEPEEWHAVVAVNMVGNANFCRSSLPALRRSGSGAVVNVASCYAIKGRKGMALYDATKAALVAMTRTLAFEEADQGIRVDELMTQRQDTSLLGRWADPIEIAFPILWLASSEASFITGTTLVVDGGLHIK